VLTGLLWGTGHGPPVDVADRTKEEEKKVLLVAGGAQACQKVGWSYESFQG
jgi:hypothetical protein